MLRILGTVALVLATSVVASLAIAVTVLLTQAGGRI
jgi:hypothetical protein